MYSQNSLSSPKSYYSNGENSNSSFSEDSIYDEVKFLSQISQSRFPLFLVMSPRSGKHSALKAFPFHGEGLHPGYLNESRFISLDHPNIIKFLDAVDQYEFQNHEKSSYFSYILMDLAVCDFADLLKIKDFTQDEVLCRTYFSQLIDGIEYLHSHGISHLDIKLENLLLGGDYQLKITDFDFSFKEGDDRVQGKGTVNYRAPELLSKNYKKLHLADIYSAGIILFAFKLGCLPYSETGLIGPYDLKKLLFNDPEEFWTAHEQIQNFPIDCSQDFKSLFLSMVTEVPEERATIKQIKQSKWMQGPVYGPNELYSMISKLF